MQNFVGAAQSSTHCRLNLCSTHQHHEQWELGATVFVLQLFHGCPGPFTRTTAEPTEGSLPFEEDTRVPTRAKCTKQEERNPCGYDGRLGKDSEGATLFRLWFLSLSLQLRFQLSASTWLFINPNLCQGSGA